MHREMRHEFRSSIDHAKHTNDLMFYIWKVRKKSISLSLKHAMGIHAHINMQIRYGIARDWEMELIY